MNRFLKTNIFIFTILQCINVFTQDFSREFKKTTQYEWDMKEYAADKSAEAVVLYDIGKTKFIQTTDGFEIFFNRQTKIKILNESGIENGVISILIYKDKDTREKVENLEGYTYNYENGIKKITPLDPKLVYEEKVGEFYYYLKFAMPAVKEGSIIEFKYTLQTPRIFYLRDWSFQCHLPTVYSEYEIHMIPFYQYTWLLQGASKFDYYNEYQDQGLSHQFGPIQYYDNVIVYGMKNIPAFRDEEFITSIEDYILKLDFQLSARIDVYGARTEFIKTWPALSKELLANPEFGKYINASARQSTKLFDYNALAGKSDSVKYSIIVQFVKSNYNWNGYNGFIVSKPAPKFVTEKIGNAANINLFLCGMLQEAGLDAYPVILSARDHGKIKMDLPFASFFNYVVVLVTIDGKKQLADATDSFMPDNLIPEKCLNDKGLVIQEKVVEWAVLSSSVKSVLNYQFIIEIPTGSDSLLIDYRLRANHYDALTLRKKYSGEYEKLEEYFFDKNLTPVDSIIVENYLESNKEFIIKCNARYAIERINEKIYITPFLNEPLEENPFKQSTRNYPIDLKYPKAQQFYTHVTIPEGYSVEYLPQNLKNDSKVVTINYLIDQKDDNTLVITGNYSFNEAVYNASDYLRLKFLCNDIIKKFNEKIVLVKNQ